MRRLALMLVVLMAGAAPAAAERLASTVSTPNVQITSSFDGAVLSLFGNIESDAPGAVLDGPYNVIVVITGPLQDRVTRLKTNNWGIWTNTDQVIFKQFPSFYDVLASGKLDTIAEPQVLDSENVLPIEQAQATATLGEAMKDTEFGTQLVRLMTEE